MKPEKKWDSKKLLEKIMHTRGLVIILIIGIMLLVASGGLLKKPGNKQKQTAAHTDGSADYANALEQRLQSILSGVSGVGAVDVMITLEDTGQNILAYDEKSQSKTAGTTAVSVSGGAAQDKQTDSKVVLRSEGGAQTPVTVKEILPQVAGVLIVADGGSSEAVRSDIVSAVRAVLNVKPHKVCVVGRAQ